VFAHDPQQSMLTNMNERATAYVSGWNKAFCSSALRRYAS
jgi:hypothetical protein